MTAIAKDEKKINILIADDHPLFRRGLKNAFSETDDIHVEGEVENSDDLLKVVEQKEFDLVLMDITMPGKNSLEVMSQLKAQHPRLPVMMLSVHPEDHYAVRFIKAGAAGYLTKDSAVDLLMEALHESLSNREFQVFCKIAHGQSLTEIGNELSLSVKTISTHRTRILDKMKMTKNAELIHYAIDHQLL